MKRNMTDKLNNFKLKAQKVHRSKYDYNKVIYINSHTKICIICPEHGEFLQRPYTHLVGQGCPICGNLNKTTSLIEFIEKAKIVHKDSYNYSKVNYVNSYTKICIICPIHGEFYQIPKSHIEGHGCLVCGNLQKVSTLNEFIEKAQAIHGNKYEYTKVIYTNSRSKVIITCKKHGDFEQKANNHLQGAGCPICKDEDRKKLLDTFIKESNHIHNYQYEYSKSIYINAKTDLIITCKKHGDFIQKPNSHLKGNGCPICKASKGELRIKQILDKYNIKHTQEYRIPEVLNKLYYDFYLPKYNLLIEFHGIQHYNYSPYFHRNGEDDFLQQKDRDDIVRFHARYFRYRYLEFNYKQLKYMTKDQFEEMVLSKISRFKDSNEKDFKSIVEDVGIDNTDEYDG